jgi:hypothetical protein
MVSAAGSGALMSSTDYGQNWLTLTNPGNVTWTAVCGTSQGNKLFAFGTESTSPTQQIVLYTSTIIDNQSVSWTKSTSPAFFADIIRVNRVRCSGDGIYIVATDNTLIDDGRFLYSSDGGSTWTRRPLHATLPVGRTFGVTMSRSGAIQYLTFQIAAGSSSSIWRSFDYGATFSLISNQVTDDLLLNIQWYYLECDATGRFLYATRYNSSSTFPRPYRSADYGATFTSGGSSALAGIINVWISATGQFVVGMQNPYESSAAVVYSNDYGRTFSYYGLGNVLYSSIAGSADGSILVLGAAPVSSGDGKLRIARLGQQNIQDLSVTGGTIVKASGTYTLTNDVVFWVSSTSSITNASVIPLSFTAIDLTQYNIRYEFDINWNHAPSGTTIPQSWLEMNLNGINTVSISLPQGNPTAFPAQTNWTNAITEGNTQTTTDFNQSYLRRFFTGFAPEQATSTAYRNRTRISGELSLSRRITGESGITDHSVNSRQLLNKFNCDNSLIESISNTQWFSYSPTTSSIANLTYAHQRIHGTALWDLSAQDLWTSGPAPFNAGITSLSIFSSNLSYGAINRSAETSCRVWRVRK